MIFILHYSILLKTMLKKKVIYYNFYAFLIFQNLTRIHMSNAKSKQNFENTNEVLSQIIFNTLNVKNNNHYHNGLNESITTFFKNLDIKRNTSGHICSPNLIHSSFQSKMRMLKSTISTCTGYCRLSMNQNGLIEGARDFKLESKISFYLNDFVFGDSITYHSLIGRFRLFSIISFFKSRYR